MKSFKSTIILLCFLRFTTLLNAQTDNEFKPYGRPVFNVFSDVKNSFSDDGNSTYFEIARLYLGYEYFFSNRFSAKANIDIGDPGTGNLQMTAYVKNAYLQYKVTDFTARFGMISTDQFNLIDRLWGYRYVMKTLQDEYGFGSSADLGAGVEYSPSEMISFDASVLNGEGFRRLQSDSTLKYTAGMTFRPFKGMVLRAYTDIMKKEFAQNTVSFFAGYNPGIFNLGVEYSLQKNNRMTSDHDYTGLMVFASTRFAEKFSVFARYDKLWSVETDGTNPWNFNRDGQLFLTGIDYSPVQGVRFGPVYRGWVPDNSSLSFASSLGIYLELKL